MPQGHYDDWDNDDLLGAPRWSWRPWFRSHQALTSRQMNAVWGTALGVVALAHCENVVLMNGLPEHMTAGLYRPRITTPTLTLRDQFAMAALPGLVVAGAGKVTVTNTAIAAYNFADAMLEARK
jgi:hypothetical protein